jgi:hypothetical protein
MKTKLLSTLMVSLVVAFVATGCSEINLKINVHPDLSADFSELINLDQKLSAMMDLPEGKGADIWQTLPEFAKAHNWTYKEKATNQLVVTGNVAAGKLPLLQQEIISELAVIAHSYGIGSLSAEELAKRVPASYDLKVRDYFFFKTYELVYDVDLSADGLGKNMQIPPLWQQALGATMPEYLMINLEATTPWTAIDTNGRAGTTSQTTNWTLYFGRHNHVEAVYRVIEWPRIIAFAVFIIILLIFPVRKFRGGKSR